MSTIEDVLSRLHGVQRSGSGFKAKCPAHEDGTASLSVSLGDHGGIVLHDFGGCSTDAVVASVGLEMRDLMPAENGNGHGRKSRPQPLRQVPYEIRNASGEVVAIHRRTEYDDGSKTFSWERDGKPGLGGLPAADLPLYGSEKLEASPDAPVILCEGEKACGALTKAGLLAVATVTGASSIPSAEVLSVLAGRDVLLWPDFDEQGRKHMERIAERLSGVANAVRWIRLGENKGDDAADFFARGKTREDLLAATQAPEPAGGTGYIPRCFSLADLVTNPPSPVEWRVDRLIQRLGITGLIGRPKIGKSFLLQYLGLSIVAGLPIMGKAVIPCRVLYIDEEMGKEALYQRWLAMRGHDKAFEDPETLSRFFTISLGGLSIDKPDEIRAEIEKAEPQVLIVDSFRRVYRGQENDSGEVARAMALFGALRSDYSLDVILSHHTRKNLEGSEFWEDAARGSSDFFAACDALLGLGKRGKGLAELRGTFRNAPEPDPITLALNDQTNVWEVTDQIAGSGFDSRKALEEILTAKPGASCLQKEVVAELQTRFGRSADQAERIVGKLPVIVPDAPDPLACQIFKRRIPGGAGRALEIFFQEFKP